MCVLLILVYIFDGTRATDVIHWFYELNGGEFHLNTNPIIRVKRLFLCLKTVVVIVRWSLLQKNNYDEGTLTYGWSVAVSTDEFDRELGEGMQLIA